MGIVFVPPPWSVAIGPQLFHLNTATDYAPMVVAEGKRQSSF
jgi:hypothetical protein